ncbi:MAG: hypothetical protein ACRDJ9_09135 [Dehalococcoidia bacterium]
MTTPTLRPAAVRSPAIVLAIFLLTLTSTGLWTPAGTRAQEEPACLVPGLGIRPCGEAGLIATGPVSISRGAATFTVQSLISAGGETVVRIEIAGLPAAPRLLEGSAALTRLTLSDRRGTEYAGNHRNASSTPIGFDPDGMPLPGATQAFHVEGSFAPLNAPVREVEIILQGPEPVGAWTVRVPVIPIAEAGLTQARSGDSSATIDEITVRVAAVASDESRTVVQLVARARPPWRTIENIAGFLDRFAMLPRLELVDDQGRTYPQEFNPPRTFAAMAETWTEDLLFPPLAADAQSATLAIPFVTAVRDTPDASLFISLAGLKVDEQRALNETVILGAYSFRVTRVSIIAEQSGLELAIGLDLGDWRNGQKLVSTRLQLEGAPPARFSAITSPDRTRQWTEVRLPLAQGIGDDLTLIFRGISVAVEGPWHLEIPVR